MVCYFHKSLCTWPCLQRQYSTRREEHAVACVRFQRARSIVSLCLLCCLRLTPVAWCHAGVRRPRAWLAKDCAPQCCDHSEGGACTQHQNQQHDQRCVITSDRLNFGSVFTQRLDIIAYRRRLQMCTGAACKSNVSNHLPLVKNVNWFMHPQIPSLFPCGSMLQQTEQVKHVLCVESTRSMSGHSSIRTCRQMSLHSSSSACVL